MSTLPLMSNLNSSHEYLLLERLGGEPVLAKIIKGWFLRIFKDEELKHFFRNVDMRKVTSHQYEFLWVLFTYVPDDFDFLTMLRKKHERLFQRGLNETHFDRFLACLVDTLHSLGVQGDLVDEAAQRLSPIRHVFLEGTIPHSSDAY